MITLRAFRPEDASGEGDIGDEAIIGITAELNGEVAGYAGIRDVLGKNWAFFRVIDERLRVPALLHRTTLSVLRAAAEVGISPIFTFCDSSQPNAEAWLKRLGFELLDDNEKDEPVRAAEGITGYDSWVWRG